MKELKPHRGRHTEFVSVYIPKGYDLIKIIQHLSQEQGTASNIKSASTRKNVTDALERMIQHLRLFKKTPPNGLAVFSGNIASKEGKSDLRVWSIEPPVELNTRIYRCDKEFLLEPLAQMCEASEVFGLVVMDRRDAHLALLKGKTIVPLLKTHSEVPGKFRAGGQCLVKDTLIQSCDGGILQLKFSHNPCVLKTMVMENFSLADSPVTDRWDVKKSHIYKITTKSPRFEIQASKDHVFFVRGENGIEEKPAEQLKEGEYLIMPEKITVKSSIQTINSIQYYNAFSINEQGQALLKQKRMEKGLFQKQLAKQLGITQTTISSYEIGKMSARRIPLQKVCAALEIDFYDFLRKYTTPDLHASMKLPVVVDHKLAQFLGYLLGDGCIEKDRITFFEQNKQVALKYKEIFDNYLHMISSYRFRESKNYHQLRFTSRPLVRMIISEFPEIKKTHDSEIPKKILNSPDEILASFLKGIFDAEGYVSTRKQVALGISNKILAQQVQMALLRFSIISSLHEYDNRRNPYSDNPRFTIDITEKESLELFRKNIGLTSEIKNARLNQIIDGKSVKSNVRQILIPGTEIRKIIENSGYNLELFPKVNSFFRNERMMSKEAFNNSILCNITDKDLHEKLEKIHNHPFLPVKISKIEIEEKEVEMVDISVGNQNFIANGVIVHNSAQRFARLREGAAKDHYKKVGNYMKEQFMMMKDLKGILVGGPGPTKYSFVEGNFITDQVKKKIIAVKDLSYTEEFGLQELVDKSQDVLAKEEIAEEKQVMTKFFTLLSTKPGMVSYGQADCLKHLETGVVDTLLLSEELADNLLEQFEEKARELGTKVKIISTETREGVQLRDIGRVAAILRFDTNY